MYTWLHDINYSLFLQEITHFLVTDSSTSPLSRLEGLRLLRQSIEIKHQLVDLVNGAEGKSLFYTKSCLFLGFMGKWLATSDNGIPSRESEHLSNC